MLDFAHSLATFGALVCLCVSAYLLYRRQFRRLKQVRCRPTPQPCREHVQRRIPLVRSAAPPGPDEPRSHPGAPSHLRTKTLQDSVWSVYAPLVRALRSPAFYINLIPAIMMFLAITLVLAAYCSSAGGLDLFMQSFLSLFLLSTVVLAIARGFHGSRAVTYGLILLIQTGVALHCLLQLPADQGQSSGPESFLLYQWLALFLGLIAMVGLHWVNRIPPTWSIGILCTLLGTCGLALLLFGRTVHGTRAWIYLGSQSIQVTELMKLLALTTFALIFSWSEKTANVRLLLSGAVLLGTAGFLVFINETGTLIILVLTYMFLAVLYCPNPRLLILIGLILAWALILGAGYCYFAFQIACPEKAQAIAAQAAQSSYAPLPAANIDPSIPLPLRIGAILANKAFDRVDFLLTPQRYSPYDFGYGQIYRATQALALSGWLGSSYHVSIPVVESDYIFSYLLLKMGVLLSAMVILVLLIMFLEAQTQALTAPYPQCGAVAVAFSFCLLAQGLISAASASAAIPTVGLPFPFLSQGGSACLIHTLMALYILYVTGIGQHTPQINLNGSVMTWLSSHKNGGHFSLRFPPSWPCVSHITCSPTVVRLREQIPKLIRRKKF